MIHSRWIRNFGMRTISDLFTSLGMESIQKKEVTAIMMSFPTVGQSLLKKITGNPSGPGAFRSYIWNKVALISSGEGMLNILEFSSSVAQGRTRWSRWVGKETSCSWNKFLKFSKKAWRIRFGSVS